IVSLAKKIGSYNYSILPYPDCCSFMVAKHPETHAHLSEVEKAEDFIENKEELVERCVSKAELKFFDF
ncbi:MAG TPA: tRNA 4-thiouridine(8) synthase ThiI, partial [Thermoplasmata archaeon]|nr:tRNA 4-thiouridine(8) synthase ThiI [Thermoplasmata archaeon]